MFMTIFIETSGNIIFPLDVDPYDTILTVKEKITDEKGFAPKHQLLIFASKMLDDAKTLADYNIQHQYTIRVVWSCRGESEYSTRK